MNVIEIEEQIDAIVAKDFNPDECRYAVTRETFPLTSQTWEEGDVHEQGSTRDST